MLILESVLENDHVSAVKIVAHYLCTANGFVCWHAGGGSDPVVRLSCSSPSIPCVFRASTVAKSLAASPCCPACNYRFEIPGPQPSGTMDCHLEPHMRCDTGNEQPGNGQVELAFRLQFALGRICACFLSLMLQYMCALVFNWWPAFCICKRAKNWVHIDSS